MRHRVRLWILGVAMGTFVAGNAWAVDTRVSRDEKGIWFIESRSVADAFEAMGYSVAQDRLWQLELYRRTARGTLSEIFGESQLVVDEYTRTRGYTEQELQDAFAALPPQVRQIIGSYVSGINRRIDEVILKPQLLPFEFYAIGNQVFGSPLQPGKWTETDVLAWCVTLTRQYDSEAFSYGQIDNAELMKGLVNAFGFQKGWVMFQDLRWLNDPKALTMIPPSMRGHIRSPSAAQIQAVLVVDFSKAAREMKLQRQQYIEHLKEINAYVEMGSQAWVLSGRKTKTGNPILYSGPQMGYPVPSVVLEGSLKAEGVQVSGMTVSGIPGIIIGRTPQHAWSFQVGHAHTVDLYLDSPGSVIETRQEIIKVAGKEDVVLEVSRTAHGPVVYSIAPTPEQPDPVLVSWKYSHWGHEFDLVEALLELATSQTVGQFGAGVEKLPVSLHICYADRYGNIAYWMSGRDPVRPQGVDPRFPPLGDGSQEWPTPLTLKPRPFAKNPGQGYFGGWNTKASVEYDNTSSMYYGVFHRTHVIQDVLSLPKKFGMDDLKTLMISIGATDSIDGGGNPWKYARNKFFQAVNEDPTPQRLEALALLRDWDGHLVDGGQDAWISASERSEAWVLQGAWVLEVTRLTFRDEFGLADMGWWEQSPSLLFNVLLHGLASDSAGIVNQYDWFEDSLNMDRPNTWKEIVVQALDNALAQLGPRPWHVARGEIIYVHDLLGPLLEESTALASRASYIQFVEMGEKGPVRIESIFPLGESGTILMDQLNPGQPILDDNFTSLQKDFNSYKLRSFPLFGDNEQRRDFRQYPTRPK